MSFSFRGVSNLRYKAVCPKYLVCCLLPFVTYSVKKKNAGFHINPLSFDTRKRLELFRFDNGAKILSNVKVFLSGNG